MNKTILSLIAFGSLCLIGKAPLCGQVVLTGSTYTQNFNGIPNLATAGVYSWSDNSTLPGWYATTTGASTPYYRVTNTNGITPSNAASTPTSILGIRSGGTGASDGTFGIVSNSTYHGVIGAQFTNNTGSVITSLTITYTGEQWSWNTGMANTLDFAYSLNASSLSTGTWTDYNSLDFTALFSGASTNQALNGNSDTIISGTTYVAKTEGQAGGPGALNYTTITATITGLSIAEGETFWLRWSDNFSGSGLGQTLGIDNFSLTAVPEPSTIALLAVAVCGFVVRCRRARIA